MTTAELGKETPVTPDIEYVPETPQIPEHIEKGGVSTPLTQVTAQVTDDTGQQLIQTPATSTVTITLPQPQEELEELAKGNIVNAVTWFALFWVRMVKKAFRFGWKVVVNSPKQS